MKKKLLSCFLALSIVFALAAPVFSAEPAGFTDVDPDAWYAQAVSYCRDNGLMGGTDAATFAPDAAMTRSMLAVVLYRIAGEPEVSGPSPFADVVEGSWYTNAVKWAQQGAIIQGYGNGRFGVSDPVSREQIAVILWRYAGSPEAEIGADFADEELISAYAADAVDWVQTNKIMSDKGNNRFDPAGRATRAETAMILMNYTKVQQSDPNTPDPNPGNGNGSSPSVLIAYFSWAGHTKQIAEEIHAQIGGDLFEIAPKTPYTSDINELSGIASREQRENVRPALGSHVENMEQYDVIFVGYPCW